MHSSRSRGLLALLSMAVLTGSATAQSTKPGQPSSPGAKPGSRTRIEKLFRHTTPPPAGLMPPADNSVSAQARQQIAALVRDKKSRTPAQRKIGSQLIYAARMWAGKPIVPGLDRIGTPIQPDMAGRALVEVRGRVNDSLLTALRDTGAEIRSVNTRAGRVVAMLGLPWLEVIASRNDVRAIKVANQPIGNAGFAESEGVVTHQTDVARRLWGVTGTGSKVAVLSDSMRHFEYSQATGDLPEVIDVLPGQDGIQPDGSDSGEGTAMMEIVYDMAPGAEIGFASAFESIDKFAQNIRDLHADGANIIVDDVIYFLEAPFQDDVVAQAVNDVTAAGALYFSSAGNLGAKGLGTSGVWEGDFRDGGPATFLGIPDGRLNRFVEGPRTNLYNLNFYALGIVHWTDPMGGSANDYDVFLLSRDGRNVMAAGTDIQDGTQDPLEVVFDPFLFNDRLYIVKNAGAQNRGLRINSLGYTQDFTTNGTIWGHAAAVNAFAVAAVDQNLGYPFGFDSGSPLSPEWFTSDGPRRIFYNPNGSPVSEATPLFNGGGVTRLKPDLAAADGVTTYTPGFTPFYGTSAAAPHAAAITATVLEVNPNLVRGELAELYDSTALDLHTPGYDDVVGSGLIMTTKSIQGLIEFIAAPTVKITNITARSADIAWKTPISANSTVTLTDPTGGTLVFSDGAAVRSHQLALTGLTPGTKYAVDIQSTTPSGSVTGSQKASFTTLLPTLANLKLTAASGFRDFATRTFTVDATLSNTLEGAATDVVITGATLSAIGTTTSLPITIGTLGANEGKSFRTVYPMQRFGTLLTLRVTGTFKHGDGKADSFVVTIPVPINNGPPPPPAP